jgi:divalent anion:Na+ symporter, DASS family
MSRGRGLLAVASIGLAIAYLIPHPAAVTPQGWRQTAIFISVIAGMIIQPLPASVMVLLGLVATAANGTPLREALGGYAEPSVWLVVAVMMIARALLATGIARRIALVFVRAFGRSSLGVSYALLMTDVTLAAGVPSITARSAGMVLPIGVGIAEMLGSRPGPTASRLGTFLIVAMYQGSTVACAMFLTGQASNILGANLAAKLTNARVLWSDWLVAALVPGIVSCLVVPAVVYRLSTPELKHTPEAASFAARELAAMGPLSRDQTITLAVFLGVGLFWVTSAWHGLEVAFVALVGVGALLVAGSLTWADCVSEQPAWDMFVWYGGLLRLGELLGGTGVPKVFAESVGQMFVGTPWLVVLIGILIIYFYSHYFFASITTHILAMFPPFLLLLIEFGVPAELAVFSLLCLSNLPAGLTHYGTTSAPILFSLGYVTLRDWWRVGAVVSLVNLVIWLTVGFAWWKWLGFW